MSSYPERFEEVSEEQLGDKGKHQQVWEVWVGGRRRLKRAAHIQGALMDGGCL